MNEEATEPPVPVPHGGNGPTLMDEEELLAAKFGKPNGYGIYGAAPVVE